MTLHTVVIILLILVPLIFLKVASKRVTDKIIGYISLVKSTFVKFRQYNASLLKTSMRSYITVSKILDRYDIGEDDKNEIIGLIGEITAALEFIDTKSEEIQNWYTEVEDDFVKFERLIEDINKYTDIIDNVTKTGTENNNKGENND